MRKKKWVPAFLENETEYLVSDIRDLKEERPVYIEIGMGMGDFITKSAVMHPEIFYVGLEREETCVARAIRKARDLGIDNFRVILADAAGIEELLPEKGIDRIYLHFPDPWPKKRNHKRRLTYPPFLEKYKKILKDGGFLVFKSDNRDFFEDSLGYFERSGWKLLECDRDYHPNGEPMTAYQEKFTAEGKPICYAKYQADGV